MAYLEGSSGESFSLKGSQHGLGLQSCIWTNLKTSRTMSFGQMRPNTAYQHKHLIYQLSRTVVKGWWFGLVLQPQDLGNIFLMNVRDW